MKFTRIVPHFPVPDVVRAADYYVARFGFTNRGYFLDPPVYAIVERDGVELHFGKSDTGESAPGNHIRRGSFDAYIHVEDLDTLHKELQDRNAKILEGPVFRVYGMREIIVEDLNGYKLAFGEPATASFWPRSFAPRQIEAGGWYHVRTRGSRRQYKHKTK